VQRKQMTETSATPPEAELGPQGDAASSSRVAGGGSDGSGGGANSAQINGGAGEPQTHGGADSAQINGGADSRREGSTAGIHLSGDARVDNLVVHGPVAGRDVVTITQDLTYDVSDLSFNPYRGLASFTYDTRDFYGGRDQQIGEALSRLTRDGDQPVLLFVTGASGSGKSSFVQAGLVPALERWYAGEGTTSRSAVVRPGARPLLALQRGLQQLGVGGGASDGASLDSAPATNQLATRLAEHTQPRTVNLLVVDQFEELFTQSAAGEREAVCSMLGSLPGFEQIRTHVLVTVRSDYLPTLFDVPQLFEAVKRCGIELRAMTPTELSQAIRKPLQEQARRENKTKRWDAALVDRLVEDVGADPTLLPLLQVTLTALWDEPPHRLTLDRYRTLGDALDEQADRVYARTRDGLARAPEQQTEVIEILLDLVEVSLDDDPRRDVRRTVARRDLVGGRPQREQLIEELVEARLLATTATLPAASEAAPRSVQERGSEQVDIIHESLLRNWRRLSDAIAARREALQNRERLRLAVVDWVTHRRSDDYLLEGVRLAQAQELTRQNDIALRDADAQALVRRSSERDAEERQRELDQARSLADEQRRRAEAEQARADEQRRRAEAERGRAEESARHARRLRTWLTVAVTAAVLAVVGGAAAVLGFVEADRRGQIAELRARINASRELGAEAQLQIATNPELAILLAREGLRIASTDQADAALRSALARSPARLALRVPNTATTVATFSPDGSAVLTAADDGAARVYDATTGELERELRRSPADSNSSSSNPVTTAAYSPDARRVVTVEGSTALVWDAATGALITEFGGHSNPVRAAAVSNDGRTVATGDARGVVLVWDAASGELIADLAGHRGNITAVRVNRDATRLLTASADQTARVWDVATSTPIHELRGHAGPIIAAAWDAPNERILTASTDGTACIWSAASGALLRELRGHARAITSAAFSHDGAWVVTADLDGEARVWNAATGDEAAELKGHAGRIWSASFSPDGQLVVTAGTDHVTRVWDARTGRVVGELRGHTDDVMSAEFSADSAHVISVSLDGSARVWDVRGVQDVRELRGHTGKIWSVAFSPDGRQVASGAHDNTVRIWTMTGSAASVRQFGSAVTSVAFSPDGRRLALAMLDGTGRVVDAASGTADVVIAGHSAGFMFSIGFSPDGSRLVTAGHDEVARLWDASTGQRIGELRGHVGAVASAIFAPDGLSVATAGDDGTARLWDARTFQQIRELSGHTGRLHRVAFAPDGRRLVTGGADGTARVWDVSSGRELTPPLRGHTGSVFSVAVSPDGRLVLTGGEDGTAVVWDSSTWQQVAQLRGATQEIPWAVFSPDAQLVVTASADGVARLYRRELFAPREEVLALVATRLTRQPPELSDEERAVFLHER